MSFSPASAGRRHPRAQARGLTLIEVMVALTISLFIGAALTMVYVNMKLSYRTQDSLSQLSDSERLALSMIGASAQAAGYYPNPSASNMRSVALPAVAASGSVPAWVAEQMVSGTGSGTGTGSGSDTLTLRYRSAPGDGVLNCQGLPNSGSAEQTWSNTFAISAAYELTCSVNGGSAEVLTPNVYSMAILYGVDRDNSGSVDTYLTAANVTTAALWTRVRSVRVTLKFVNAVASSGTQVTAMPFPVVQNFELLNNLP